MINHCIKYDRWTFSPDKIKSGNVYLASSLLGSSLEVNSFYAEVECDDPSILNFQRNAQLLYYAEADRPMIFRVQNVDRVAPKLYKLSATSTLGLLTEGQHYGGIYVGETAKNVISSICGTVPYIVKSNLSGVKLYGWLPIASPRDNLSQVLLAIGATLKTDLDGVLRIEPLWDGISRSVGSDRMYVESGVGYTTPVTSVVVTEHQYIKGTEEKSLYEGTALEGDVITFSEPMHSLTAEGFRILAWGANWARLSAGTGALRGKVYIHNTREVVKPVHSGQDPNVKTVKDATLVSLVNSEAVANRLKNFYQWRETIDAPMVYQGETPGDRMSIYHPFDKSGTVSCLQSADITLSNTLKAQVKSLVNFVPDQVDNFDYYNTREIILTNRVWVVPDGVESIRVVLIGGGQGGSSGVSGKPGSPGGGSGGGGGAGGDGGAEGAGGKIFQFSLATMPGERYEISVGTGGAGGQYAGSVSNPGGQGGDSTFGDRTSANGSCSSVGFIDPTTAEVFAAPGERGAFGGSGGKGGTEMTNNLTDTEQGESVPNPSSEPPYWTGGYGGISKSTKIWIGNFGPFSLPVRAGGGGGGGGAMGGRGGNGTDGDRVYSFEQNKNNGIITGITVTYASTTGGIGGSGGNAAAAQGVTMRGGGGNGGHGGGGGGGGGAASGATGGGTATPGAGGSGGAGSSGSAGAPGLVIIYYGVKTEKESGQFVDRNGRSILGRLQRRFVV